VESVPLEGEPRSSRFLVFVSKPVQLKLSPPSLLPFSLVHFPFPLSRRITRNSYQHSSIVSPSFFQFSHSFVPFLFTSAIPKHLIPHYTLPPTFPSKHSSFISCFASSQSQGRSFNYSSIGTTSASPSVAPPPGAPVPEPGVAPVGAVPGVGRGVRLMGGKKRNENGEREGRGGKGRR